MGNESTYKGLPLYSLTIDEDGINDGITIMSIVDKPAVESDFMKFSSQKIKLSLNDEKRIVTGCALRADYPIYRKNGDDEFYVTFGPDAIEKIVQRFMKSGLNEAVNIMHDDSMKVDDVFLFESFILNDNHRVTHSEFEDISNGSWMVSYKVDNDRVWDLVKEGRLRGFSVEINANMDREKMKKEYSDLELLMCSYLLIN